MGNLSDKTDIKWVAKAQPNETDVTSLRSFPKSIATILAQRKVYSEAEALLYFNPSHTLLHDPFLMQDMEVAVKRVQKALKNNEKLLIYGDYDVDGTTAVALVFSYFKNFFSQIEYYIPDRYKEGYGISKLGIDYANENNFSLIVALDCGIRSVDLVDYANSLNIDFIICDHHLPGDNIPNAVAVLDPKRADCNYPFKELSGCGVGFKLCQAFGITEKVKEKYLSARMELLAMSIASDIVPIVGENRILAHYGLKKINTKPSVGVKKLIEIAINKPKLTIGDLVFYLGPRINAAGRMHDAKLAVQLMITDDEQEAIDFAEILHKENKERQVVDAKITAEIQEFVAKNPNYLDRKTHVFHQEDWHKGVIGIAASRAVELYYRPTFVLTKSGDRYVGSARSVKGFDVHEALQQCSEHLIQFGGHMYAAGLALHESKLDDFISAMENYGQQFLTDDLLTPKLFYDTSLELKEVDDELMEYLKLMEPFGPHNMTPVFMASAVKVKEHRIIGKDGSHLRLEFSINSNKSIVAVGFGLAEKWNSIKKADAFDICFQINENIFNGRTSLQLMLKDIRITNER